VLVKKIVSIKGVARFEDLAPEGDVAFRKLTLVYGDNGSGKSTLAALLRSLGTGQASYVDERATLGSATSPQIKVLLEDNSTAKFASGAWDKTVAVEVFDSDFVNENVYAGDRVESEHRKNLYEVVVGNSAVLLARRIDEINTKVRALSTTISGIEKELAAKYQGPFALSDFIALANEQDVKARIEAATSRLSASRRAKEIVARSQPKKLPVPALPTGMLDVLRTSVHDVSARAAESIAKHVSQHLDRDGERWLRQGLGYVDKGAACPFCQQDLVNASAVETYQAYFSEAYRQHALNVQQASDEIEQKMGDEVQTRVHREALSNRGIAETWKDLANLDHVDVDLSPFDEAWERARQLLRAAFKEKAKNPSEVPSDLEALEASLLGLQKAVQSLVAHNAEIDRANTEIAELKRASAAADQQTIEAELRHLRNVEIRHEEATSALCDRYTAASKDKADLEVEKKRTRAQLEEEAKDLLSQHEAEINRLLECFGARFRIVQTKPSFSGGAASSTYRLSVNDRALDLGDSRTPKGQPCFRTALSAGDKSALGLAFFLAKIRRDAATSSKLIVFDDPLSSFDLFRQSYTQQEITRIADAASQVIVLSHDPYFLKGIREASDSGEVKMLMIAVKGLGFTIREWNVEEWCLNQNHKDYFVLQRFLHGGSAPGADLVNVARSIRPYVEGYLRFRFPMEFANVRMLGEMMRLIRESTSGELNALKGSLSTLDDLNTYSRRFHHGDAQPVPAPNETELRTFAGRAINYVRGSQQ